MTLTALVFVLSTPMQAPAPAPAANGAQSIPLHPRVEIGLGLGLADDRTGFIPRVRGGATLDLDIPNLVLGGDVAAEGFITGEEGGGFATSSYWEAVLTPRMFAGYEIPIQTFSLVPYAFVAVSGGVRVTTVTFFGRTDDTTDIAFGGRVGLGLAFAVQMFFVSLELDAGWKDLGPAGTATLNGGLRF
jgi:hypothetical protein